MSASMLSRIATRLFGRDSTPVSGVVPIDRRPASEPPEPEVADRSFEPLDSDATTAAWFHRSSPPRDPVDSSPDTARWWRRPAISARSAGGNGRGAP